MRIVVLSCNTGEGHNAAGRAVVFAQVGESFSKGEPAVETFRSLWSEAFAPQEADKEEPEEETPAQTPETDNRTGQETQPEGGEESGQTSP